MIARAACFLIFLTGWMAGCAGIQAAIEADLLARYDRGEFDWLEEEWEWPAPGEKDPDTWPWSESVGGLEMRIEPGTRMDSVSQNGLVLYVRLRNVGDAPVTVGLPARRESSSDELRALETTRVFLEFEEDGIWQPAGEAQCLGEGRLLKEGADYVAAEKKKSGPWGIRLDKGESALVALWSRETSDGKTGSVSHARLVWKSDEVGGRWRGEMRSPEVVALVTTPVTVAQWGKSKVPTQMGYAIPYDRTTAPNEVMSFARRWYGTEDFRTAMWMYRYKEVDRLYTRWLRLETNPVAKLVWATEDARWKGPAGKRFVQKLGQSVKIADVQNYCEAIGFIVDQERPPKWALEAMLAAMEDERELEGGDAMFQAIAGTEDKRSKAPQRFSTLARWRLIYWTGQTKEPRAVPPLIKYLERRDTRYPAMQALGAIGNEPAQRALLEVLKSIEPGGSEDREVQFVIDAVGKLKLKDSAEHFIPFARYAGVPIILGDLGDPRAIPALKHVAEQQKDGVQYQAIVALVKLEEKDPVAGYCRLLAEARRDELVLTVFDQVKELRDVRLVAAAEKMARENENGHAAMAAVNALREMKMPEAVDALIGLLDIELAANKTKENQPYNSWEFDQRVVIGLQQLTRQEIGNDKAAWKTWWENGGKANWK